MTSENTQLTVAPGNVLEILQKAVATKQDVETLRGLFELQKDFMKMQAEQAFAGAMARLQAKIPQVSKFGQAKNSKFAKLEDIDVIIRPLLAEEEFSFSFDEESHTEKTVTFVAKITHAMGHSETKRLTVPIDVGATNSFGKSIRPAIQDAGSTVSYARRYLIKMHLNLIEKDEDTDGESAALISEDQVRTLETLIQDTKTNTKNFLELIAGVAELKDIPEKDFRRVVNALETKKRSQQK